MTDKELKTIKTIAELGSIQKAAVQLQKNPSSISRMVHRVEEDLDIVLFTRTPEGLKATAEGEIYLKTAAIKKMQTAEIIPARSASFLLKSG